MKEKISPRVFIIHGWGGTPRGAWRGWLADELTKLGAQAITPAMPQTDHPRLEAWLPALQKLVSTPRPTDIFVGHSLGVITILRYLESLPAEAKAGGAALVAGFMSSINEPEIATFFQTDLDFEAVKKKSRFVAFNSDNDQWVPWAKAEELRDKLGAKLILMKGAGHINEDSGFTKFPELLEVLKGWF